MTDEELLGQKEEVEQRWAAIYQEPDEAKRTRLLMEFDAYIQQKKAQTAVELVERVRALSGDEAADEMLQALRRVSKRGPR